MHSIESAESDFSHLNAMLDNLNQLLAEEYAALKRGDVENLEILLEQKSELLQNLEGIATRIEPSLAALQSEDNSADELPSFIQDTLTRLAECHSQNQINGGSIEANRKFSESLLTLLTQRDAPNAIYDANGKTRSRDSQGTLSAEA